VRRADPAAPASRNTRIAVAAAAVCCGRFPHIPLTASTRPRCARVARPRCTPRRRSPAGRRARRP
jgi:hypothetical protein